MKGDFLKAKTITKKTRDTVLKRQCGKSVTGRYLTKGFTEYHHYIERSSGGVGYEWNTVALTSDEHRLIHDGKGDKLVELIRFHLESHYDNWSEDICKYHKGWKEEDYGVNATEG